MYERTLDGERVLVVCSFWHFNVRYRLPAGYAAAEGELLLGNYPDAGIGTLRPYEAQIWRWRKPDGSLPEE